MNLISKNTKYALAHDVGTSSVKSALVSREGNIIARASSPYGLSQPLPGRVEQNPDDYWEGCCKNTRNMLKETGIDPNSVSGMAFSTQAMGIIPINSEGKRLKDNITWVDGRAEEQARKLMNTLGGKKLFVKLIGVEISGKDVIPKLRWLKQHEPELYAETESILDVNGYLKFRATGKKVFEWSGACSYGFNLKKKDWERLVFKAAGVNLKKLPPLVRSIDAVGTLTPEAAKELGLPESVVVYGGCDDTQSAALGSGSTEDGEAHIYLGTSAWAGITTSRNLKHKNGAAVLQSADYGHNLIVGITESAGSNLDWMIEKFYQMEKDDPANEDIFAFIDSEREGIPPGSDHLIFTPWLLGERCPVSSTTTRGTLFNIGPEHSRGHLVNALLEGVGYNLRWIFENMRRDYNYDTSRIRAIGGGSVNRGWMQGIANITRKTVETLEDPTLAGAMGAAACVLVGEGCMKSFSDINNFLKIKESFIPDPGLEGIYDKSFRSYKDVYYGLRRAYMRANRERFENE